MEKQGYEMSITKDTDMATAEEETRAALTAEGFGILTEIDVAATLEAKLGVTTPPYKILGACNPNLAHQALDIEPAIGLLLPCNVTLRMTEDGATRISAVDPAAMLSVSESSDIQPIADEARSRLVAALTAVESA
ncbi:hypothetical protein BMS3Abin02_02332 [bacterium BMS3Abin02]|nr:hypothetical protein BMS3Abin02_02332 [bacterium BMS3Abin02]GBE22159.1 hypothetical protein BMS3Bbin01_01522 [bacterium BMS3Bbin01]